MSKQQNQSQEQNSQQSPGRDQDMNTQQTQGKNAAGYDPNQEQQQVSRESKELTEESNDSKNPNPSQAPGKSL